MNVIPLLKRKLKPPRLPTSLVERETLNASLAMGLEPGKRLSLICGGPGYGKSTAAAAYMRHVGVPGAWYALDESDADLATFLTYVHGALATVVGDMSARTLELLRAAPQAEAVVQTVVGLLAEELAEDGGEGGILALDDYQEVAHVAGIRAAVAYMAQYLPENWQLIVISREYPNLALPQLRVRQQLVEVGIKQLRFSAAELRELLTNLSGLTLSDAEALELVNQTDGWVASVVLAAQAVNGAGSDFHDRLFRQISQPAALYDYLGQEVLERQPTSLQRFLLESAFLDDLTVSTCKQAWPDDDVAAHIHALVAANLLFDDDTPTVYRYQPSFQRFLRTRAEETMTAHALGALCRRLGTVLACGADPAALPLLIRAQAWQAAETALVALADDMLSQNQLERLRSLVVQFPVDFRASSYALCFWEGEVLRRWGDFDQALGLLTRSAELAPDATSKGRALIYQAAIHLGRGDPRAHEVLEVGVRLLAPTDLVGRGFAFNLLGAAAYGAHDLAAAIAHYEQALACYREVGDIPGQAKALVNLGLCDTRLGLFDQAIASCQAAISQSERAGRVSLPMTYNNLAAVYTYQGRFAEAWSAAERAMELAQLLHSRRDELYAHLALGAVALGLEDWRRADASFQAARDGAIALQDKQTAAKAVGALAEVAQRSGALSRARTLIDQAIALAGLPLDDPRQSDMALQWATIAIEAGELEPVGPVLERLAAEFATGGYRYRQAQVAICQARLAGRLPATDTPDGAQTRWQVAIALCEAHGFDYLLERALAGQTPFSAPASGVSEEVGAVAPAIAIQAFGAWRVSVGDRPVAARDWRGYKTKLILAYMLANPEGVTKETLTDLLYGESDTTRTAILVLVSRLRHALEPDLTKQQPSRFVHFVDGRYRFNTALPYELDTQHFLYHLKQGADETIPLEGRRGHWRQALATYVGPYLVDLTVESPWLAIERERYRRLAQEAHSALMRSYLAEGDVAGALQAAEQNLVFDACCEQAHQVKMACLARQDQREQAIRHFQVMRQVFARELDAPPSAASEALYQAISQGREVLMPL